MRGLDTRIAKLEKAAGLRDDPLCVILRCFDEGELCGYRSVSLGHESIETIRRPGESKADLLERAEAASPRSGMIVLREVRANPENDET